MAAHHSGSTTDTHTLYVKTYATSEQLSDAIRLALERAGQEHPEHRAVFEGATYALSVVCIADAFHFGYAYVWLDDSRLYHAFLGRDFDGQERWDRDWTPPTEPKPDLSVAGKSWADAVDEEEAIEKLYSRPKLPPLVRLVDAPYAEGQQEKVRTYVAKGTGQRPESIIVAPCVQFAIEPATASEVEPGVQHNVLCIAEIPTHSSAADLRAVFGRFSTSDDERYPAITVSNGKTAFIEFDSRGRDASFARMLTRKLKLSKNGRTAQVVVDYSKKKTNDGWQTVTRKSHQKK